MNKLNRNIGLTRIQFSLTLKDNNDSTVIFLTLRSIIYLNI